MCQLFGLIASNSARVFYTLYLRARKRSSDLPEGWGVAWFDRNVWHLVKEAMKFGVGEVVRGSVKRVVRGSIVISHVTLSGSTLPSLENIHPWLYGRWAFAHVGSLDAEGVMAMLFPEYRVDMIGESGSEAFFRLLIQEVGEWGRAIPGIRSAVRKVVKYRVWFDSLNFLASDGERLYALRYVRSDLSKYPLYYLRRPRADLELRRLSTETGQLIRVELPEKVRALVIASEIVNNELAWRTIPNRYLLVADRDLTVKLIRI